MGNLLYEILENSFKKNPKKNLILTEDEKFTYKKIKRYSDSVAAYLDSYGIKKGDRVGIFLPNCWQYIPILFAIFKIGAVAVPINSYYKSKELSEVLEDANIKLLFAHDTLINIVKGSVLATNYEQLVWVGKDVRGTRFRNIIELPPLKKSVNLNKDDLAVIFFTSGTDAEKKGVMLSSFNIISLIQATKEFFNITQKDRIFLLLPIFHSYTSITGVLAPISKNASIYIANRNSEANFIDAIIKSKSTILLGIPNIYHAILKVDFSYFKYRLFSKLKYFISGAAPLSVDVIKKLEEKFYKTKLIEGYGLTEAGGVVTANRVDNRKLGSVGKPLPGIEIKVVSNSGKECRVGEVGEILVKSDSVMIGYLNKPELTNERLKDGWLYTRDLGYIDEDGFLFLKGRKSELIINNGINVYPLEIENVIDRFSGVKKSAVIGYKDNKELEKIIAFIELEDGEISIEKLDLYVRGFLADYKIPHKYIIIDKLPRNATGKILKKELKNYAIINVNI